MAFLLLYSQENVANFTNFPEILHQYDTEAQIKHNIADVAKSFHFWCLFSCLGFTTKK